jgi:hypothetical protein
MRFSFGHSVFQEASSEEPDDDDDDAGHDRDRERDQQETEDALLDVGGFVVARSERREFAAGAPRRREQRAQPIRVGGVHNQHDRSHSPAMSQVDVRPQ